MARKKRITRALRSTRIGGKPVSYEQWRRGDLAAALLGPNWKAKTGGLGGPGGRTVTLDRPPPGTYDPNIDVQERAARRGYGYTLEDLVRGRERSATDFGLGRADIERQHGESISDLLRQRTQGQQDYQTNLQTIARNFQRLGNVQAQRGRQVGLEGGFARQAARKRAANQAIERAPVDLGFQRFMEGSKIAEQRTNQARDRQIGQLSLGYGRGEEDFGTTERRAGTEFQNYLQDAAEARQNQYGGPLPTVTVPVRGARPWPGASPRQRFRASQQRARQQQAAAVRRARRRARRI